VMPVHAALISAVVVALTLVPLDAEPAGQRCLGRRATIVGSSRRDVLLGTPGTDVIVGGKGRDRIDGLGDADLVCGGPGRDRLRGGDGHDALSGGRRADTIDGDGGDDRIAGGRGVDTCFQGSGTGEAASCVPVVAAAGDIACDPGDPSFNGGQGTASACRMRATSDLLLRTDLAAVLTLGDNQYEDGAAGKFADSYGPTWGRARSITHPSPGNHDYGTANASGYFGYFGPAAGDPSRGYYSFDLASWHFVALNSNCSEVDGCGPGSTQQSWLRADLAAHPADCTLAYWHHARFSSGTHGTDPATSAFWVELADAGADLVLAGHDHVYERFGPQRPDGTADPGGIRQFVVGTGGRNLTGFVDPVPNSEVRSNDSFGVLELALGPGRYAWRFVPVNPGGFTDAGSSRCR
jgi:hypothetical protein